MSLLKKTCFLLFALMFISIEIFAQKSGANLKESFSKYQIVSIDAKSLKSSIESQRSDEKKIVIEGHEMTLFYSNIISSKYKLIVASNNGTREEKNTLPIPMNGYTRKGGRASLTFNEDFIYGFFEANNSTLYIEPISHYEVNNKQKNAFVIYDVADIIDTKHHACGTTEKQRINHEEHHNEGSARIAGQCFEVENAIASDWLMFQSYGSSSAVQNHAIGVLNNVQTNYDNEFADEIQFTIVTQFVSSCSTCDPWPTTTNAETLLDNFANWAPAGFVFGHDLGSLWTKRDIQVPGVGSGVIGIAYLGAVCTQNQYNLLEDWSSNANLKRVMVAHEFGHNFDADHDGAGSQFIMAPSVQNTTTWSAASKTSIQNYYNGINCLSNCASAVPNANFSYNINSNCTPGFVQFTNSSTGNITNYNWVFQGGSPATSTLQNPLVTYANAGIFDVSLTVSSGSQTNTLALNDEIEILGSPIASFTYNTTNNVVDFNNTSSGISTTTTFDWDFGDNASSGMQNPVHTYAADGTYTVTLTIENDCGVSTYISQVVIATLPTANFSANQTNVCGGASVNFTSTSSANSNAFAWTFNGGSPATSTLQNPTVLYTTPGVYPVTLTVTNNQGNNTKTIVNFITVNANPVASFTYTQTGLAFNFNSTSTNATTYLWNFGDGVTSTQQNPTHTYANPGNYTVTLNADNPQCNNSIVNQSVMATAAPISIFTASATSGCASFTTTFTSTSSNNPTSYAWSFPGGNPSSSSEQNPTVVYSNTGSYNVSLVTTNSFGSNTLSLPNYIQVATTPITNFTYANSGLTYTFTNTSSNANSYSWDFGDGTTSTLENPSHTYASQGNYTVKLTTSNQCGQTNNQSAFTITFPPVANATSSNGAVCSNETVTYTDVSTGTVVSRNWTFAGGSPAVSTAQSVDVSYPSSGAYNVRLIVENIAGNDTFDFVKNVIIKPLPVALPNSYYTAPTTHLFINESLNANNILWTLPNGMTSTEDSVEVFFPSNGNYVIILKAFNECGVDSFIATLGINQYANANFFSNLEGLGECAPITVDYAAGLNDDFYSPTFAWTFEGGSPATSSLKNPQVTYTKAGEYDVELIVTNSLGADTSLLTNYITLGAEPTVNFIEKISGGNIQFEYTGSTASSYLWDFGGQGSSTLMNPAFTFTSNGTYTITCIATNSCGNDTLSKQYNIIAVGTNDVQFKENFKIYPNPTSDYINIESSSKSTFDIQIIDNIGRTVFNQKENIGNQKIDVQKLTSGLYMIMVKTGEKVATFKFGRS